MGKISPQMVHAAYDAARRVHAGKLAEGDAVTELVANDGMNPASTAIYVISLSRLLEGRTLKRTLSASSFSIYIDRIAEDYGVVTAKQAIAALRMHVIYYNSLGRGNLNRVSAVCDAAEARLG